MSISADRLDLKSNFSTQSVKKIGEVDGLLPVETTVRIHDSTQIEMSFLIRFR